jgi:hypothetical protein
MVATPFEQDVVAEAENATGPERVTPFAGEVTVTPANAADAVTSRHTTSDRVLGMLYFSKFWISLRRQNCCKAAFTRESLKAEKRLNV